MPYIVYSSKRFQVSSQVVSFYTKLVDYCQAQVHLAVFVMVVQRWQNCLLAKARLPKLLVLLVLQPYFPSQVPSALYNLQGAMPNIVYSSLHSIDIQTLPGPLPSTFMLYQASVLPLGLGPFCGFGQKKTIIAKARLARKSLELFLFR